MTDVREAAEYAIRAIDDILLDFGNSNADETLEAVKSKLRAALADDGWRDISTAPKDGTPVDLWVRSNAGGTDADEVSFYCNHLDKFNKKTRRREGMARDMVWTKYGPNEGWYSVGGLRGMAMTVEAVLWRPRPLPPAGEK